MIKALRSLTRSRTLTTGLQQALQLVRLVVVLPWIIYAYSEFEVAAWLLFSASTAWSAIIGARINLTFTRMIALASGGATNLAPVTKQTETPTGSGPNEALIKQTYDTLGALLWGVALVSGLLAFGLGFYGLNNLQLPPDISPTIWLAFAIVLATTFSGMAFQRYRILLMGMDLVPLVNWIEAGVSVISIICGVLVLWSGGDIAMLAFGMQGVMLISLPFFAFIIRYHGRFSFIRGRAIWSRSVIRWAWPPLWKGLAGHLANTGLTHFSGIIITSWHNPALVASYLLAVRMITVVTQLAEVPFVSHLPRLSRLLASGDREKLARITQHKVAVGMFLTVSGVMAGGWVMQPLLSWLSASSLIMPLEAWLLLGLLAAGRKFNEFCLGICALGNHIILYGQMLIVMCVTVILLYLASIWSQSLMLIILCMGLPGLVILHGQPLREAARMLQATRAGLFMRMNGPALVAGVAGALILFIFGPLHAG